VLDLLIVVVSDQFKVRHDKKSSSNSNHSIQHRLLLQHPVIIPFLVIIT